MSQIDKVTYVPLLCYFIILFIVLYFFIFCFFLKCFLVTFYTRNLFFSKSAWFARTYFFVIELFLWLGKNSWGRSFCKDIYTYFHKFAIFFQIYFYTLRMPVLGYLSVVLFSPLEQFDLIYLPIVDRLQFPFFNVFIPFLLLFFIFAYIIFWNRWELSIVPGAFQRLFEMVVEFVFNLVKQQIGREGYVLFPLIFTLFNFILFTNLLSLIPFGIALTSHLIMILWLSLSVCLSIFFVGLYIHNIKFLKIFIPECPLLLLPMLILIEYFLI